jgi:hypothetical protein
LFFAGGENDKREDISVNLIFIISNRASDTEKKKTVDVLICICIVYFIDISGYGTKSIHFDYSSQPQNVVIYQLHRFASIS